jgi:hypothetical protein
MEPIAAAIFGVLVIVALVAWVLRLRPGAANRQARVSRRADTEPHGARAAAGAEMEEHDIDDMLDAIAEHRRRRGGRDIGEELADELLRGSWDE